jgi:hypothetical protein
MSARHRRLPPTFVVSLIAAGHLFAVGRADAEVGPPKVAVRLEYTRERGAERCPDEEFLRAEAANLIGFDPFQPDATFYVVARVRRQEPEMVASIWLRNRDGVTQWADEFGTNGNCETLVKAVALSIVAGNQYNPALLPPPAKEKEPAPEPPGPPLPTPAPEAPRHDAPSKPAPAGDRTAPAPPERWQMEAELGAVVAFGVTPGIAAGPMLSVKRRWSEVVSAGVEARGLASLSSEVEDIPVATSVFTVAAVLCLHRRPVFGCGLAELGAYRFVPEAPNTIRQSTHPLLAVAARLGVEWPLSGNLAAHGTLDVIRSVADADLSLDPHRGPTSSRSLWASLPVGVALGFGLATTF